MTALVLLALGSIPLNAQTPAGDAPLVVRVPVHGTIDTGLAVYLQRVLQDVERAGAQAVILDINTLGGRVDAAVKMRDALLASRVPTIAFVNQRAISAGALITLAAHKIVMAPGSTVGAATPVQLSQPGTPPQAAEEKMLSYVRKEFSATAEQRGRNPLIAEAMVDASVEIPNVTERGKLLTLTTEEAQALGVADGVVPSVQDVVAWLGLEDARLETSGSNWAEMVVRAVTHPVVSSLLMSLGMLALMAEIYTAGFGLLGVGGVVALALFFGGHLLAQLAGYEALLLLVGGMVLLLLELLVAPGFLLAGMAGAAAVFTGLVMTLLGPSPSVTAIADTAIIAALSLVVAGLVMLLLLRSVMRASGRSRGVVLNAALAGGDASNGEEAELLGEEGVSTSPLRPAGIALIHGQRRDVVTEGEYVPLGERVVVTRVDGNRIVVRRPPLPQEA